MLVTMRAIGLLLLSCAASKAGDDALLECVSQALFFTYGGMEPRTASTVAEMLGFNPDLVMPQLQRELDAAQQTNSS